MTDTFTDPGDDRWDAGAVDEIGLAEDASLDLDGPLVPLDSDERPEVSSLALFDGDDGGLELAQRRALVVLLKKRFISAQTDPKEWKALIANPGAVRSRLHDLFLDLHLDTEYEVAFKRQVQSEAGGQPFPTLLYDAAWGREDTIVLVYLRGRFRHETAAGAERVFVDVADIVDYVSAFRPGSATDRSGDARRTQKAIETIYKSGLLIGSATGDRFQVSNAIEPLLTLETLQALQAWLRKENDAENRAEKSDAGTSSATTTISALQDSPPAGTAFDDNAALESHAEPVPETATDMLRPEPTADQEEALQ